MKEIDYLTIFNFNTSNFYGLQKVHKSNKIAEAVNTQHSECIRVFEPDDLTLRNIQGQLVQQNDLAPLYISS